MTYNEATMGFWTYAELSVPITCSCLPSSPRFFRTVSQKLSTFSRPNFSIRPFFPSWSARNSHDQARIGASQWKESFDLRQHKAKQYNTLMGAQIASKTSGGPIMLST